MSIKFRKCFSIFRTFLFLKVLSSRLKLYILCTFFFLKRKQERRRRRSKKRRGRERRRVERRGGENYFREESLLEMRNDILRKGITLNEIFIYLVFKTKRQIKLLKKKLQYFCLEKLATRIWNNKLCFKIMEES